MFGYFLRCGGTDRKMGAMICGVSCIDSEFAASDNYVDGSNKCWTDALRNGVKMKRFSVTLFLAMSCSILYAQNYQYSPVFIMDNRHEYKFTIRNYFPGDSWYDVVQTIESRHKKENGQNVIEIRETGLSYSSSFSGSIDDLEEGERFIHDFAKNNAYILSLSESFEILNDNLSDLNSKFSIAYHDAVNNNMIKFPFIDSSMIKRLDRYYSIIISTFFASTLFGKDLKIGINKFSTDVNNGVLSEDITLSKIENGYKIVMSGIFNNIDSKYSIATQATLIIDNYPTIKYEYTYLTVGGSGDARLKIQYTMSLLN